MTVGDPLDFRIGDTAAQRICETLQGHDLERPAEEVPHLCGERFSYFESVVHLGHLLVGFYQPLFTLYPGHGELRSAQIRGESLRAGQPCEGRTEPFRVRRVLFLDEKAQSHEVSNQT